MAAPTDRHPLKLFRPSVLGQATQPRRLTCGDLIPTPLDGLAHRKPFISVMSRNAFPARRSASATEASRTRTATSTRTPGPPVASRARHAPDAAWTVRPTPPAEPLA
jgi:hypothetical protein